MADGRTKDRLIGMLLGALVTLLVLGLGTVAFYWWLTTPAEEAAPAPSTPPGSGTDGGGGEGSAAEPPADLAEGDTWLGDLTLDAGLVVTSDSVLRDVEAAGQDVLSTADGTTVGRLDVDATVPFEVIEAEIGEGATVRAAEDGQASVQQDAVFAGRRLTIVATGTVEVVDGRLVVEPRAIDIGGPALLAEAIADVARELVTIEHTVEGLPEGLVLQQVTVQDDGFRASLQGEDVRLLAD
jgi:hypothetical protein